MNSILFLAVFNGTAILIFIILFIKGGSRK